MCCLSISGLWGVCVHMEVLHAGCSFHLLLRHDSVHHAYEDERSISFAGMIMSALDFSQPIHLDWLGTTIIRREGCFQLWFTDQQQSVVVNTPAVICWHHLQKSPGYSII